MSNLDDLFDTVMDDKVMSQVAARYDPVDYDDSSSPQVMQAYYKHLFPFKQLFTWLNQDHIPCRQWTHREFAFTLQNDAYLRYNSFSNGEELKKEILRLNPARFEIGPVYSGRPKDKKTLNKATFKPLLRELVFDVDMTDYDSVRQCCSDKKICKRCWAFITQAAKVVDNILREDFGFKHLLWVYSGRRGIHCWVSDRAAMELTDDQRKAVVNWIDIIKGGAKQDKKVNLPRPLHPSLERSLQMLKESYSHIILRDQECFKSAENAENLLKLFPQQGFASELREQWQKNGFKDNSTSKWNAVLEASGTYTRAKLEKRKRNMAGNELSDLVRTEAAFLTDDVILQYVYPRIDTEVSKHLNHLLKSPFCIHPGTGRVCIPFATLKEIEVFDPEDVPTVGQLLRELEKKPGEGYKGTSMRRYVEIFEKHCEGIVKENLGRKKASNLKSMEF